MGPVTGRMPALFAGHGSPMNAIEENEFHLAFREIAARLPRPRAVLCVSAHWQTQGVFVTASDHPSTIHDFQGFPRALHELQYSAPGSRDLAMRVAALLFRARVSLDPVRGLDHGCWGVLRALYPDAGVPVVQLSLDISRPASFHYSLGRQLEPLRDEEVLIVASGNIVHNLALAKFHRREGLDWAVRFNDAVKRCIVDRDHDRLISWPYLGPDAALAVPTPEHYLPLLYALAVQGENEPVTFFNDVVTMGSVSMTSVVIGRRDGLTLP